MFDNIIAFVSEKVVLFDIIFVILSVSLVMIGIHYLYDTIRRRYDILSKKNVNFKNYKSDIVNFDNIKKLIKIHKEKYLSLTLKEKVT